MNRKYAFFGYALLLLFTLPTPAALAGVYLSWPTDGAIITPFSPGEHRGIDIAAAVGSRIAAAEEGVVYWVGRTPRGEPCVSIDHPDGHSTSYFPVEAGVAKGQNVAKGAVIGALSADGDPSSEEPHLHFGLFETATRDDKRYLNPQDYLTARIAEPASDIQPVPAAGQTGPRAGAEAPRTTEAPVEQSAVVQTVAAAVGLPAAATATTSGAAPQGVTSQTGMPEQQFSRAPQTGTPGQPQIEAPSTTIRLAELPSNIAALASAKTQAAQEVINGGTRVLPSVPAVQKSASVSYAGKLEQAASDGSTSSYRGSVVPQNIPQALPNIVLSGSTRVGRAAVKSQRVSELQTVSTRAGPNPFSAKEADLRAARPPAPATAGRASETAPASTVSKRAVFKSKLLPDLVLAFALTFTAIASFRFARRVKKPALSALTEAPAISAFAA
ncbi:MAG: M23 family metallopeptidase [Actinobacteria bacterium]|nr:M23 family metallopeptidase [Actinomycetota bacterium]